MRAEVKIHLAFWAVLTSTTVSYTWKSHPVEARNQSLYDSVTNKPWYGKGIGFPDLGDSAVEEYIAVLHRINELSANVNLIRLYQFPSCAITSNCFEIFMQEADSLGIYVLVPGTGTIWGWLPNTVQGCHAPDGQVPTANDCYKAGGTLGWGQKMVQQFYYPNTLAIVIGNEYDQMSPMWRYFGVIKAYARDLKNYMNMCNTDPQSPTKGKMRKIPLAFANSDDGGDYRVKPKAEYLFCGSSSISVDIFGLNIERWCDDTAGRIAYNGVNKWVADDKFPGAFMFTEMGCSKYIGYTGARSWAQVPSFFQDFPAVNSYIAYTYNGNPNFDMFDGPTSTAKILDDGTNFFKQVNNTGAEPSSEGVPASTPTCATDLLGTPLDSVDSIKWYDTGSTGWAPQCPKPYQDGAAYGSAAKKPFALADKTPAFTVTTNSKKHEIVIQTLVGTYTEVGSNHGRKYYQKLEAIPGHHNVKVFLYYWDNRDGADFSGWWFGPQLGGSWVWARCSTHGPIPPRVGWKVPWDAARAEPGILFVDPYKKEEKDEGIMVV